MQAGICFTSSETGGRSPPRFDMAHLLQARPSRNLGRAIGLVRVAPEMIKALPWKALNVIRQIFERRYMTEHTGQVALRMLVPPACPQLLEDWELREVRICGYQEGRSATENSCDDADHGCSRVWERHATEGTLLDLKQASDGVTPKQLLDAVTHDTGDGSATRAAWRTQHVGLQEITIDEVGVDISIKAVREGQSHSVQHGDPLLAGSSRHGVEGATTRLHKTRKV